jgi:hypothetical protein
MTSQAIDITKQISTMSEPEVEFIWDFLRKRRNESLLKTIDIKLEDSINSKTLCEEETNARLEELGIA